MNAVMSGRIAAMVLATLLMLVLFWSPALALDLGEWIPGLKLSPFLSERVDYETNIFQTSSHSKDDIIFRTIPGFLAERRLSRRDPPVPRPDQPGHRPSLRRRPAAPRLPAFPAEPA